MKIIKGPQKRNQRVGLYGLPGVGKTTLASSLPNSLLLDLEHGSDHLNCDRVHINSFDEFREVISECKELKEYQTLIVDSVDKLESFVLSEMLGRDKKRSIDDYGYGSGYIRLSDEFRGVLRLLDSVLQSHHIIMVGHAKVTRFEPPDSPSGFDRIEPKLSKFVLPLWKEWLDHLVYLQPRVRVIEQKNRSIGVGDISRFLIFSPIPAVEAKTRWSGFPPEAPSSKEIFSKILYGWDGDGDQVGQKENKVETLRKILGEKLEPATKYLVSLGWLSPGQGIENLQEDKIEKILSRTEQFLSKLNKLN